MSTKDKRMTIDLEGANLKINGEIHKVTTGRLVVSYDYIYKVDDDKDNPTGQITSKDIDIETEKATDL